MTPNDRQSPEGLCADVRYLRQVGEHSGGSPVDAFLENLDFARLNVGVAFR